MNCSAVRTQILALPDPRELTPELRGHVLSCAGCQAWARQAARLEGLLAQLPVPAAPGEKKEALLGDLMQADPVILPLATPAARPGFGAVAGRFLRTNAGYVAGLAAAVLVAVGLYSFWPAKPVGTPEVAKVQKDPLLEKLVSGNAALARAGTPAKRLEVLGTMADAVASDARAMARLAPADIGARASQYETLIRDGVVPRAQDVQRATLGMRADERAALELLAEKLKAEATAAEALAKEVPQDAQPALARIVEAAREGEQKLRAAARGGK